MQPAWVIRAGQVKGDPAMASRGARKLLVTSLYPATEHPASTIDWQAPAASESCAVQVMPDTELAVFNERAKQTRHRHLQGTEIYSVIEGSMRIEVEGAEYELGVGDTIVVNPGAYHEVRPAGPFVCQVVTANCGGPADRLDAPALAE